MASLDEETGHWDYIDIDWRAIKDLINNGGPMYERWVSLISASLERNEPYRNAALAAA
jgi:hypothetical protein